MTEYKKVPLAWLKPYENNPRDNEKAVPDVAESIRQVTYITPIVTDEDGVILAGHTRLKALEQLGETEVDVIVASGMTETQKRKFRLFDNKAGEKSRWDAKKLLEELQNVDFGGYDFGQPMPVLPGVEKRRTKVCPCCGEEFEI